MSTDENSESKKLFSALLIPALFVILIVNVKLIEVFFHLNLAFLGVYPRTITGLRGILFAP